MKAKGVGVSAPLTHKPWAGFFQESLGRVEAGWGQGLGSFDREAHAATQALGVHRSTGRILWRGEAHVILLGSVCVCLCVCVLG